MRESAFRLSLLLSPAKRDICDHACCESRIGFGCALCRSFPEKDIQTKDLTGSLGEAFRTSDAKSARFVSHSTVNGTQYIYIYISLSLYIYIYHSYDILYNRHQQLNNTYHFDHRAATVEGELEKRSRSSRRASALTFPKVRKHWCSKQRHNTMSIITDLLNITWGSKGGGGISSLDILS